MRSVWLVGKLTAMPFALLILSVATGDAQYMSHPDVVLNYKTCDGREYTARWAGPQTFQHTSHDGRDQHYDTVINYLTWDHNCWKASWDPVRSQFFHKPLYSGGNEHPDIIINYVTWDGSKWSASRADVNGAAGFYHMFVAPPDSSDSLSKAEQYIDTAGKVINLIVKAASILPH